MESSANAYDPYTPTWQLALSQADTLLDFGFHPMSYEPFARRLVALDEHNTSGNTLYVRPSKALEQRLREAPAARVLGDAV